MARQVLAAEPVVARLALEFGLVPDLSLGSHLADSYNFSFISLMVIPSLRRSRRASIPGWAGALFTEFGCGEFGHGA